MIDPAKAAKDRKNGTPEAQKRLRDFLSAQKDWTGRCRVCGVALEGSLQALKEHSHVVSSPSDP